MKLEYVGKTDVGLVRQKNEDAILMHQAENLFVVADGMGGHRAGDVAAQMVVEVIERFFLDSAHTTPASWPYVSAGIADLNVSRLTSAVQFAHHQVLRANKGRERGPDSMGATLVALHFVGAMALTAHAGDCRCYRYRKGHLKQLTQDHTMVEELLHNHGMTIEEVEALQAIRHVVTRALGVGPETDVQVDIGVTASEPGDIFLLCSDGLHSELPADEIVQKLDAASDLEPLCWDLVAQAKGHGGRDNVSVVLVRFLEGDPPPDFPIEGEDTQEIPRDGVLMEGDDSE